jgi:YVTN family beta-propeller protein
MKREWTRHGVAVAAICAALMTMLTLHGALGHAAAHVPHTLYVANQMADTISVVDGATFVVVATIPTGRSPHEILVDVSKGVAYVSNRSENTVSVMDLRSRKDLARIPAPEAPHGLALSADGATLFSTGRQEINVIELVTLQRVGSIPVGQRPHMLRRSPDKMRLYTGNMRDGTISVIDIARRAVIATIPVGRTPEDLAISPDGREIFVGNQDDDSVTVIDAATHAVTATVKLPERAAPIRLRYSPDGKIVFISSRRNGAGVLRMDRATRTITGHLPLDRFCGDMNFSPDHRVLYITDFAAGTISQVDPETMKVIKTLPTGWGADCIEVVQ